MIGPMAVGKTTLGAELAQLLGWEFVDSDQVVESQHGKISDIFASRGESWFRQLEARTIATLLRSEAPLVLSLGGGAVLDTGTQQLLVGRTVVYLNARPETVRARILRSSNRPLLAGEDPIARWQQLKNSREGVYQRLSDLTLDVSQGSARELAQSLLEQLDLRTNIHDGESQ
nr:shikimate kinase [Psychromicrobium silvestre]